MDNSIKLIDKRDNKIYGLLIFSEYNISVGSPLKCFNYNLAEYLSNINQINGYSFIIDKRLRGTTIHKQMLLYNINYIKQFDLIWIAVEKDLKTHNYWKRLGFEEILSIDEASFYIKAFNKNKMLEIFILKALSENEKNYS